MERRNLLEKKHASRPEEILEWLEQGQVSPAEAFQLFRELESRVVAPTAADGDRAAARRLEDALRELDSLVGLEQIKKLVREIQAFALIQQRRSRAGLATEPTVLHMIFKGNPGTGKTTVARVLGKIFKEMGVLPKGHLVEVERADLVGEYIGHTAQRTREQIKKAIGGILFIDEAYSLARGGEKDFGKEAIDTLVKAMEDHKDQMLLILAGYLREMEWFIETNPGLRSRFPIQMEFPDYTPEELLQIADLMLKRRQYVLTPEAKDALYRYIKASPTHGNARAIRNQIERAIRRQALRLVQKSDSSRDELMAITRSDVEEVIGT